MTDTIAHAQDLKSRQAHAMNQQKAVINAAAPLTVIACPGAGKTRTVVDRHCKTPGGQSKGRALVSFTKVAAAQVRTRAESIGRPDLAQHPNVLTTLDGFFWRFLVRPFLPSAPSERPFRRLESWRDAPRSLRIFTYVTETGGRHQFDLADFQFRYNGDGKAPTASLRGAPRWEGARGSLPDEEIVLVCRMAYDQRTVAATQHHLLTGEETRRLAHANLRNHRTWLATILVSRFTEVVIDEAQDCSDVDVTLLLAVRDLGVPMVLIGDPDQAIYGFRTSGPPAFERLVAGTTPLELTGNWRSGSAICQIASTLRPTANRPADISLVDPTVVMNQPIYLTALENGSELARFHEIATSAGIPLSERFILAHDSKFLPGNSRTGRRPPSNLAKALAWAVAVLRQPAPDPRTRDSAEEVLKSALLRHWLADADSLGSADRMDDSRLSAAQLQRCMQDALQQIPDLTLAATEWCAQTRAVFNAQPIFQHDNPQGTAIQCPARAGQRPALSMTGLGTSPAQSVALRVDTIHGVKGEEAEGVLVLIPQDQRTDALIDRWISDRIDSSNPVDVDEAMRTLYVAVTRARRLLVLAMPADRLAEVSNFLTERSVPHHVTS